MKVILLENIKGIGRVGDVKEVNDGYARNFLIPRRLGKPASAGALQEAQTLKSKKLESADLEREQSVAMAAKLNGITIEMHGKANQKGTLFSGIPRDAVAKKISEVAGVHIPPDRLSSDDHLKHIGLHTVHVRFTGDITAELTIDIKPEK